MTDLNLSLNLDGENKSITINSTTNIRDFFKEIRKQFSVKFPNIINYNIIFFNGIPPKKLREIDLDEKKTLEEMKVYNNSMLRIAIDEENPIKEINANQLSNQINKEIVNEEKGNRKINLQ